MCRFTIIAQTRFNGSVSRPNCFQCSYLCDQFVIFSFVGSFAEKLLFCLFINVSNVYKIIILRNWYIVLITCHNRERKAAKTFKKRLTVFVGMKRKKKPIISKTIFPPIFFHDEQSYIFCYN